MKIALGIITDSFTEFRRLAQAAEQAGFDTVTAGDNPKLVRDPYVLLGSVASATSRVRLGIAVTNGVIRRGDVTAGAASSLAEFSGNRFWLGIGSGPAAVGGRSRLEEFVSEIRAAWGDEEAIASTKQARLAWVTQHAPLVVAASGLRGIRQAARIADGVIVEYGVTEQSVAQARAALAQGAADAGKDVSAIECWWYVQSDSAFEGVSTARLGAGLASCVMHVFGRGADPVERGVPQEHADQVRELVARYSRAAHITKGELSPNAQLVMELGLGEYLRGRFSVAGTPSEVVHQLDGLDARGVSGLFVPGMQEDLSGYIDTLGKDVLPRAQILRDAEG